MTITTVVKFYINGNHFFRIRIKPTTLRANYAPLTRLRHTVLLMCTPHNSEVDWGLLNLAAIHF